MPIALPFVLAPHWLSSDPEIMLGLAVTPFIAAGGIAYGCLAPVFRARPGALVAILVIETAGAVLQWGGAWWLLETRRRPSSSCSCWWPRSRRFSSPRLCRCGGRSREPPRGSSGRAGARLSRRCGWRCPSRQPGSSRTRSNASPRSCSDSSPDRRRSPRSASPSRIGGLARLLPQAAFAGALPVLTQATRIRASETGLRGRFDRTLVAFSLAAAAVIVAAARPIVSFAYGDDFAGAVPPLMWVGAGLLPTLDQQRPQGVPLRRRG